MADVTLTIAGSDQGASAVLRKVAASSKELAQEQGEAKKSAIDLARAWQKAQSEAALLEKHQSSLKDVTGGMVGSVLKAQVAFELLKKAGSAALDFFKDGIHDYVETEKASFQLAAAVKQLGYDANTVAPALDSMAEAMEETTLVSGETIKKVEQLLLQYGVAPRDIKRTTQAILDYSAATGKDAAGATQTLLSAIQQGSDGARGLGIRFQATGDHAKDLTAAVTVMEGKFGGSALAATEGLAGAIGHLDKAESDLGKSFGQLFATIESKYHVIESFTLAIKGATAAMGGNDDIARSERKQELARLIAGHEERITELQEKRARLGDGKEYRSGRDKLESQYAHEQTMLATYRGELARIQSDINKDTEQGLAEHAALTKTGTSAVAKAASDGGGHVAKTVEDNGKKLLSAFEKNDKMLHDRMVRDIGYIPKEALEYAWETEERAQEEEMHRQFEKLKHARDQEDREFQRVMGQSRNRVGQLSVAIAGEAEDKGSDAMNQAGQMVGGAFISGLDQALSQVEAGGEFDVGAMVAMILPVAIAAGLIAAGMPPPLAMLVGQAGGVLVKHAVSSATHDMKPHEPKYHSGGTVSHVPRFHDGGLASDEVPAVLQTDEVVWSRADVARHGGPHRVNDMRQGNGGGGGGATFFVSVLDSQSFQDYVGGRGGTGFARAIDHNRGEMAQKFRRLAKKR